MSPVPGRIGDWLRRWRSKLSSTRNRAERDLFDGKKVPASLRAPLTLHYTLRSALRADILSQSAALSYTAVFSLVPLITTLLVFLTAFPGLQSERQRFLALLSGYLLPGAVQDVEARLAEFSERAAAGGALSSLTFFVIVLMLFQSLELAHNSIWGASKARSWGERLRLLALFLVLAAIGTALFVTIRSQVSEVTAHFSSGLQTEGLSSGLAQATGTAANVLVAWALFVFSIRFLPSASVGWGPALLGGCVAGTAWHFLKSGFTWYVQNVAGYSNIYGALGTIPVFFLWVYLSFLLMLAGSCLAYAAQGLENSVFRERFGTDGFPGAFYSVVVAAELARAFRAGRGSLTEREIAEGTGLPGFFVTESLQRLQRRKIAAAVSRSGTSAFLLLAPPERLSLWRIVEETAGTYLQAPDGPGAALHGEIRDLFSEASEAAETTLASRSLSDLAEPRQQRAS